jgi:hypothetical protein
MIDGQCKEGADEPPDLIALAEARIEARWQPLPERRKSLKDLPQDALVEE